MPRDKEAREVVATNRKARHNFTLEETIEAGLVLVGSEIKSIRDHRVNLGEGYVEERGGELWLVDVHIAEYKEASRFGHAPTRPRKLLMHRKEINRLIGRVREKGYTIVPTQMYLRNGRAKVEIALARGKRQYDKRDAIAERDSDEKLRRAIKDRRWED
ncbi:MAG: SsrA-binding protein SmpB [Anaerolineae bacterium]|nr:SsrA-binding protein SmpB [Anaerolineae bacterium]